MEHKGEFKGIDVEIDSETTVENGKVNGTTHVHAGTEDIDSEFDVTFGSGKNITIDGTIIFTPPSLPGWIGRVGLEIDGKDITVKPSLALPLVDNDDLGVDLELGGDFRSDGQAQGSAKININAKKSKIRIGVEANVDEGGKFGGGVNAAVEIKF